MQSDSSNFPPVWKHTQVISILRPGKKPALPSSYHPISLLDMIGKLFEKILLTRTQSEVSGCGLLNNEQFRLKPQNGTALQLARSIERVTRDFGEKRLTGDIFVDVVPAFDAI